MTASTVNFVSSAVPRSALEFTLVALWERLLGVSPVGVHDDFFKLGGDSISAMAVLALIARETGYPLPPGGLLQAPTIAQLAQLLTTEVDPENWSPMVPIQSKGSRPPLFCVHPGGGNVLCYLQLACQLGSDQPFYALQAPGVDGIRLPLGSVAAMAEEYVAAIRIVQPKGPYHVAGWSAGGVIAFEVAQQLLSAGESVAHLAILDSGMMYTIGIMKAVSPADQPGAIEMMGRPPAEQVEVFRARSAQAQLIPAEADDTLAMRIIELFEGNVRAVVDYRAQAYSGRVDLYQAAETLVPVRRLPVTEWQRVCCDLHVHTVPGNHLSMIHQPHVRGLAAALSAELAKC